MRKTEVTDNKENDNARERSKDGDVEGKNLKRIYKKR